MFNPPKPFAHGPAAQISAAALLLVSATFAPLSAAAETWIQRNEDGVVVIQTSPSGSAFGEEIRIRREDRHGNRRLLDLGGVDPTPTDIVRERRPAGAGLGR